MSKKTILLVDGNPHMLIIWKLALGKDFHVVSAPSIDSAMLLSLTRRPDCILMDTFTHANTGLDAFSKMSKFVGIPTILVSSPQDLTSEAANLGAIGFIFKPVDLQKLSQRIQGILANELEVRKLANSSRMKLWFARLGLASGFVSS